jgi:hypothetical protein
MSEYWEPISAIATAASAIFTAVMAATTFWVIRQNTRHHRDSFKPICVLIPEGGVDDPLFRSGILQIQEPPPADHWPGRGNYALRAALKNVGVGPALKIRLEIRQRGFPEAIASRELAPLGREESRGSANQPLLISTVFRDGFNETDFRFIPNGGWEIWIEYQDVFGKVFHTRHAHNSAETWTQFP